MTTVNEKCTMEMEKPHASISKEIVKNILSVTEKHLSSRKLRC